MRKSDNIKDLFTGLVKLRQAIKQPSKDAKNPFLKNDYVTLEGVQKAIDEAKKGTGIDYSQFVETSSDGRTGVSTMIYSDKGEYIITDPLYLQPVKNDPQGNGSVITYSRRYQLSSLFGISSDIDDDGDKASGIKRQGNYQQRRNSQQRQAPRKQDDGPIEAQKRQYQQTINKIISATGQSKEKITGKLQQIMTADKGYQDADDLGKWQKTNNEANKMLANRLKEKKQRTEKD